jgi:hypothetical protein
MFKFEIVQNLSSLEFVFFKMKINMKKRRKNKQKNGKRKKCRKVGGKPNLRKLRKNGKREKLQMKPKKQTKGSGNFLKPGRKTKHGRF